MGMAAILDINIHYKFTPLNFEIWNQLAYWYLRKLCFNIMMGL